MEFLLVFGLFCQILLYSMFGFVIITLFRILRKSFNPITTDDKKYYIKSRFSLLAAYNDPMNLIILMGIIVYILILIMIKIGFDFKGQAGDIPGLYFTGVPVLFLILILVETGVKHLQIKRGRLILLNQNNKFNKNGNGIQQVETIEIQKKVDLKRKIWHFIAFGITLVLLLGGWYIITKNADQYTDQIHNREVFLNYWGSTAGKDYIPLIFKKHSLPAGQSISIFTMYTASVIFIAIDLTRLSENVQFFLHKNAYQHIWNKEHYTIAAYTHFTVAYLAVTITLPPLMLLGVLCLGCFADPAASIIGMNWGKHQIKNRKKTWEGTIAGGIAAFITMIFFVGPIYALFGTIVFVLTDLFSPKPISISDNLSMPILTTIIFVILSALGVTSYNLLGL